MIDIREAELSSAEELSELCKNSFEQAYVGVESDDDIKTYCEKNYSINAIELNLSRPETSYMIAYRDSKAVGYVMVQDHDSPTPLDKGNKQNVVELKQVYVLASEFGTGLGKLLLDKAISNAQYSNNKWLWLCVSDVNTRAINFYKKNDFKLFSKAPALQVGSRRQAASLMKRAL